MSGELRIAGSALKAASVRGEATGRARSGEFARVLEGAEAGEGAPGRAGAGALGNAPSKAAREAAEKIVAQLFYLPVIESMREFPFGKGVAYGGRTEDAFGQQLDTRFADLMAGADRSGLVERMAGKFQAR